MPDHPAHPPSPPPFSPRFQFHRTQLIGVPLLMLLPLLGLLGVLSRSAATVHAAGTGLELAVTYPARANFSQSETIEISVRNLALDVVPVISVLIESSYLARFSDPTFAPALSQITAEYYVVDFENVQPGETRRVRVDGAYTGFGRVPGRIAATGPAGDAVEVTVSTLILP